MGVHIYASGEYDVTDRVRRRCGLTLNYYVHLYGVLFSACAIQQLVDCASGKVCVPVLADCPADAPCKQPYVAQCVDAGEFVLCATNDTTADILCSN